MNMLSVCSGTDKRHIIVNCGTFHKYAHEKWNRHENFSANAVTPYGVQLWIDKFTTTKRQQETAYTNYKFAEKVCWKDVYLHNVSNTTYNTFHLHTHNAQFKIDVRNSEVVSFFNKVCIHMCNQSVIKVPQCMEKGVFVCT